jgi:hypothetical protein
LETKIANDEICFFSVRRYRSRGVHCSVHLVSGAVVVSRGYWDLMPADVITLRHFSVSSARSLPNWAVDCGDGTAPRLANLTRTAGSASAGVTLTATGYPSGRPRLG